MFAQHLIVFMTLNHSAKNAREKKTDSDLI